MSVSELAALGGVLSAVAVLISLVFLNLQVRHSDKNQRALIQQGRAGRSTEIAMHLMDADFAEVHYRCMNCETDISEIQLGQFMGFCRAIFLGAEDSFLQDKESLLDKSAFASVKRSLRVIFGAPGLRVMWAMTRECYESEFVEFMDTIALEASNHPHVDRLAQWKAVISTKIGHRKAA